jgi:hypothetical protein
MAQIKKKLIILLLLLCCCSKSDSDVKIYRTAIMDVRVYADPKSRRSPGQEIGKIPFKEKVEIIDNNEIKIDDYSFIKIKYNDVVGYVYSARLSERSDMPFVDNVKYHYTLNEFEYDRERVIYLAKESMLKYDESEESLTNKYYIDDPQIYSFYGKDCNGIVKKYIMVIMLSKLHKDLNHQTIFTIDDKNKYSWVESGEINLINKDSTEELKYYINERLKTGNVDYCP